MRRITASILLILACCALSAGAASWFDPALGKMLSIFRPATQQAAGKPGIVPAPAAGDQAKFLRADATWAVVDLSPYATNTALSTKADTAAVATLTDRLAVNERNDALTRFDLFSSVGKPGASWADAWTSMNQDYANDWPMRANAYWDSSKKALCTNTPGTNDLCTGGTVYTSGDAGDNYLATNAFNDDGANSLWAAGGYRVTYTDCYGIGYDFGAGAAVRPTAYTVWCSICISHQETWKLQGSNNNTTWTDLESWHTEWTNNRLTITMTPPSTGYRYLRWNGLWSATELEVFSSTTNAVTLRSATTTSSYSPTTGSVFFVTKELETIAASEFTARITKDSFASTSTVTLAKYLTIGSYAYYYGEGTYPTGTGTAVGFEIVTPAKATEVYGGTTYWRP